MSILTDFSEDAVNAAVEANFLSFIDELVKYEDTELYRKDDMIRIAIPSCPHPLVNMITRTRLSSDADRAIQDAMATYTTRKLPFLWQIEPASTPDNLGEKLAEHGMQSLGKNEVLVADLEAITITSDVPKGYEIKQVVDDELLTAFGNVLREGFQLPQMVLDVMLPMIHRTDLQANVANYVGLLEGKPVAVGTVIYEAGIAGFYNGTVLESARNRGIGTANALHRMQVAKERGHRICFMISGGNAFNLYARLGFTQFFEFERYLWMPPQDKADVS